MSRRGLRINIAVAAAVAATATLVAPSASGAAGGAPAAARTGEPRWELSSAAHLSPVAQLNSVTSAGKRAAWAVGFQSFAGVPEGVVLRWDGRNWGPVYDAGMPEVRYWQSVSAASARDVWTYGWGSEEVVARFDGRRWHDMRLPELPGGDIHGFSQIAAAHGRAWLAGEHWISTYDDGAWRTKDLGTDVGITGIDARSARDAWAVGAVYGSGFQVRPLALHWDGRRWTEAELPDMPMRIADVWAESADSVWVSGHVSPIGDDGYEPKVLHWDGYAWQDVTGPVTGISPQALSGDGHGGVWLAGDPAGWEGPPVFWHYEGGRWTRVDGETVPGGETQSYNVTDLAPAGHRGGHWAVGGYELVEGQNAYNYELIERSTR